MEIIDDRRRLHEIPELDRDLPETVSYLKNALSGLNCTVFSPMESALCAFFDFGRGDTLAFRADMDALPIAERTGLPFASRHPGKMHACGHDGHMAILLELARRLSAARSAPHNVLLVFQPAEETTGGAKALCETGIFAKTRTQAIFGLHLWPGLPAGTVASRRGEMMSRSCEVTVEITGKSAHIAKAEDGVDALAAGVLFYDRLAAVRREIPAFHVLNFGRMESGTARNAVSGQTRLLGTLRAFSDEVYDALIRGVRDTARQVEDATGCHVETHFGEGYPAVRNPEPLYDRVRRTAAFTELPRPSLITEDFSWYQRYLPGMFFFLGVGETPALHADTFQFDETILLKGAGFFEKLAMYLI